MAAKHQPYAALIHLRSKLREVLDEADRCDAMAAAHVATALARVETLLP